MFITWTGCPFYPCNKHMSSGLLDVSYKENVKWIMVHSSNVLIEEYCKLPHCPRRINIPHAITRALRMLTHTVNILYVQKTHSSSVP